MLTEFIRKECIPISAGSRARTGTYGQNHAAMMEYIIYVKTGV